MNTLSWIFVGIAIFILLMFIWYFNYKGGHWRENLKPGGSAKKVGRRKRVKKN
jgi:hypothetical protein